MLPGMLSSLFNLLIHGLLGNLMIFMIFTAENVCFGQVPVVFRDVAYSYRRQYNWRPFSV